MILANLPTQEERFRQSAGQGVYVLRPTAVPVPGEALTLNGLLCTPRQRSGYYYDAVHPKERIVLHFTVGGLPGDIETLTRHNYHVSVPFVIARDGTIYQLFPSAFWSGHLGGAAVGNATVNAQDKLTIGIELSNYGPLDRRSTSLKTTYGDTYCALTQTNAYQKLGATFRGKAYFATFTDAQYDSLTVLLRYLTAQYSIPRQFLPEANRFQTRPEVLNFRGIVSHVNYRASGKWDIGPAFDWARLIRDVQAPTFAQPQVRSLAEFGQPVLYAEDALIPLLPPPAVENENLR